MDIEISSIEIPDETTSRLVTDEKGKSDVNIMNNANASRLFKFYMDKFYDFPRELKDDLIYCQRSLKDHLRVHQLVHDVFEQQDDADPLQKQNILDELEAEIVEINAEQQYLLLNLKDSLEVFYKMLRKNGISSCPELTNIFISNEIVPLVNNLDYEIQPINVVERDCESVLIGKYFQFAQDIEEDGDEPIEQEPLQPLVEIIDVSDDEHNEQYAILEQKSYVKICEEQPIEPPFVPKKCKPMRSDPVEPQLSLLKPIAQRLMPFLTEDVSTPSTSCENNVEASDMQMPSLVPIGARQKADTENENSNVKQSQAITLSRINLRQALKRARTGFAAQAKVPTTNSHASSPSPPPPPPPTAPPQTAAAAAAAGAAAGSRLANAYPDSTQQQQQTVIAPKKKAQPKQKPNARNTNANANKIAGDIQSSSDDSNNEQQTQRDTIFWNDEPREYRTKPEEYGQQSFLQIFDLFSPEILVQLQQRRSKRRRRNVYSNERSDFHYGRIEYGMQQQQVQHEKKKPKAFLLSPQVKRLQANKRANKRTSIEKANDEPQVSSRSTSSSPDTKTNCNECQKQGKGNAVLSHCSKCKGYFHQLCHEDGEHKSHKICPFCLRANKNRIKQNFGDLDKCFV